jgi:phage/plasmid-associated DNA primase
LRQAEVVKTATKTYLDAEDAIGSWIDECCQRDAQAWQSRAELFASWSAWARKAGEPAGSRKDLVRNLAQRGCREQRKHAGRGFYGVKIR